jgi:DNA polymerase-3 subunit gamma/tau
VTQVLARKWRPRAFAQLVGQEHVVRALENALRDQRLHHAYLFTGTRGVGKTTIARIIAKALNCETGVTPVPCGQCGACREIDAGRFVDLIEVDAASNTQVDAMRELLENALYAPTGARYKVYLIDEVHMLSRSAFNAMLKTLEEPPPHVQFILATTDPQKIPVTVLSRCLQFNLKQIPPPLIEEQLVRILDAEGIGYERSALGLVGRAAQGSMRDALSLLDQGIAHGAGKVTEGDIRDMLGAVDQTYLFRILEAIAAASGPALLACADEMAARSLSFESALQELATLLHRIALLQVIPNVVAADDADRPRLDALATGMDPEFTQLCYQIAIQGRSDISLAPDGHAGFSMTLLRMLAFAPGRGEGAGAAAPRSAAPVAAATGSPARGAEPAVPAVSPAVAPAADVGSRDWPSIVAALRLTGAARQLAQHCELVGLEPGHVAVAVQASHRYLADQASLREKLKAGLEAHLGGAIRLTVAEVAGSANTPAEIARRSDEALQRQAEASIGADPFVRDVIEQFGARVESIRATRAPPE